MTTDLLLLFTLFLLVILIALNIIQLRTRLRMDDNKSQPLDVFNRILHRAKEQFGNLKLRLPQKKQMAPPDASPPSVVEEEKPAETILPAQPPSTIQQDVYELEQASESGIQAAGNPVRVHITAEVPSGSVVNIIITTGSDGVPAIQQKPVKHPILPITKPLRPTWQLPQFSSLADGTRNGLENVLANVQAASPEKLSLALFILALLVYLTTRFTGLADFPIYFFGDEAVQTVSAADMIAHGWSGPEGQLLPTYFQNGAYYNLSASVYAQVLPYLLFGKSVLVTRGTSALITLLAALAIGLILRDAFNARRWWLGTLLLSLTPAWFLHSRTAFETAIFVSFYAAFMYFYLLYRLRDPKYIYHTAVLASLTFYAYSPGQLVLAVTALFLFLSDIKYHWQNRGFVLRATALLAVLALPYLRFRLTVDYSPLDHLRQLGSYWILPLSLREKLVQFVTTYLYGLSPQYWFLPGGPDLARHQMRGYGNLPIWTFPLFALGMIISLRKIRGSASRAVLLAMLAAPTGGALAEIGITRVLVFVIPATILSAIGLDSAINWLEDKAPGLYPRIKSGALKTITSLALFIILAAMNFSMLNDALTNGSTWFQDYGLYGMQYGARQVFEQTVLPGLKANPKAYFVVSPSWANGAEEFSSFFIPPEYLPRLRLGQVYDLIAEKPALGPDYYFIVTPEELDKIRTDIKFQNVTVRSTIALPTGKPGFYVINLTFSSNIDAILAEQEAARRKPVEDTFEWNGQTVRVIHSPFGGGQLSDLMDGNPDTLAKTLEANPFILDYYFPSPVPTSSVSIQTGSMPDFTITIKLYAPGSSQPVEYIQNFKGLPPDPVTNMLFPNGPETADHIYIEVKSNNGSDTAQVHIREITFR